MVGAGGAGHGASVSIGFLQPQVALAIESTAAKLDFTNPDRQEIIALQQECVRRMRAQLNITRLQDGVDRRRESRSLDAARLITYGQGHCHGLSSCMAAVLHSFGSILGIDVMYVPA